MDAARTKAPVMWEPSPEQVEHARMTAFRRHVGVEGGYQELHDWSTREPPAFWSALWDFMDVLGEKGERILVDGDRMPGARWFPDARLNFAGNLLRREDGAEAIVFRGEDGARHAITFADLRDDVARAQGAMLVLGLQPGDRVAACVANVPEAVVMMLATASLGATWSSCSPDFGVDGVLDRFGQVTPRLLLATDGYLWKGRPFDSTDRIRDVVAGLPGLERTVIVPFHGGGVAGVPGAVDWSDFLAMGEGHALDLPGFPFDQPLSILFSSGTTGKPKCIVHGAGGTLLQHRKEHALHTDLGEDDTLAYFTTTGWMMWNWMVTALAGGTRIICREGNPLHPGPGVLWDLAQDERVTVFGTSAKYLDAVAKAGVQPAETHDLSALRCICSTGSPLSPEGFDYVSRHVKDDVQLASISGGTDNVSCFVLGCPILPVHRGEIQCKGLGMAVEVYDATGHPVHGEPGELVCTAPFPAMPVGFFADPDGAAYRAAYFEHFPGGVWRHGDWAAWTSRGGMVIHGRSDATLNPGGVRIGTAEIYRQVECFKDVAEAIAVGQEVEGDQRIVLFVTMRDGVELDDDLRDRIRAAIRANTSPRHVPAVILQVRDIPRTRSGKISELAVREVIHDRPVTNAGALANPEALDEYRDQSALISGATPSN